MCRQLVGFQIWVVVVMVRCVARTRACTRTLARSVLLALHGAMVTESYEDGEGLVLERVRQRVGPDLPIIVTLDLHAHITQQVRGSKTGNHPLM
jgi:hypothetical protein